MAELDIKRLVIVAEVVVSHVLRLSKNIEKMRDRTGIAICVADMGGFPHAVFAVGVAPSEEKRRKYFALAQKKCSDASVLVVYGKLTTRAYRNDEFERYVGAVVGKNWVWGSSAFIGDLDEVVSLGIAVGMGDITPEAAVVHSKENPYQFILLEVIKVTG